MLNEICIHNYKSLKEVLIRLHAFNVFIGPNNSGKSNILDCLQVLSELILKQRGEPVINRGGFSSIVWNGDTKQPIKIELSGHEQSVPGEEFARHRFTYKLQLAGGPTDYQVTEEIFAAAASLPGRGPASRLERELMSAGPDGRVLLTYPSGQSPGMAQFYDPGGKPSGGIGVGGAQGSFLWYVRDASRYPLVGHFAQAAERWSFYNFVPSLMRQTLSARKELHVQELGENFATVLHSYHTEFPRQFRQIEEWLRIAVPEMKELLTGLTEAGQTYVFVQEENLGTRIPAWAMSDGTLRLLGHVAVAFSPVPPALICFEEPENYVHPRLLELLANILKEASSRTQVLLTTHSPYLLNFLDPEDVLIVEKKEGATSVSRAENQEGIREALKVLGLGEMWYAGSLGGTP